MWRSLALVLVVVSLAGCMPVKPLVAGDSSMMTLASLERALDEELAKLLPDLESLWEVAAVCDSHKTGVGLNRRAYFIDVCRFGNTAAHAICGQVPESAEYYFLESKLVQISFDMDGSDSNFPSCVATEFSLGGEIRSVEQIGENRLISASAERNIFVKASGAAGIIVESARLSMIKPEIVPDVHYLQALFEASEK